MRDQSAPHTASAPDAPTPGRRGLSRRRLLRLGLSAAAIGALELPAGVLRGLGPDATALAGHGSRPAGSQGTGMPFPPSRFSAPSLAGRSVVGTGATHQPEPTLDGAVEVTRAGGRPLWMPSWNAPIRRLDDLIARDPDLRFPRNAIMLTIDDGPHPQWTPMYLRLLARCEVQATFCVIGSQAQAFPQLVKAAASEGHHLANHTFGHPLKLPTLSSERIRTELADTNDAIVRASGFRPRQFRAPGGERGPDVYAEVSRQEMVPLGWDIDPRDWAMPGVSHIRAAMLAARPHDIVLCHDGGGNRAQTYAALESVIPALLSRGWRFVTLPM